MRRLAQRLKTKEFWVGLFGCAVGAVGIALVVMQICFAFSLGKPEYESQEHVYLVDVVPNGLSHLTYFTNISLLLFCVYAIVKFIAILFGLEKFKKMLDNRYLLVFLAINEIMVLVVYTLMMFVFNFSIFKYEPTPHNLHDAGTSVYKHFFVTIFAAVYCFSLLKKEQKRVDIKKCFLFILYPLFYFVAVQIIGRTCYEYKWFPYPFFATDQIWLQLFGTLKNFNYAKAFMMIVACCAVVLLVYILILLLCCAICGSLQRRSRSLAIRQVLK